MPGGYIASSSLTEVIFSFDLPSIVRLCELPFFAEHGCFFLLCLNMCRKD